MNSIENVILLQDFESAIELIYSEYDKTQDEYLALYIIEIADNEMFHSKNSAFWLILKIDQFEKNCKANNPKTSKYDKIHFYNSSFIFLQERR